MTSSVPQQNIFNGLRLFRQIFRTLLDLIYPPICHLCDNRLTDPNQIICDFCWENLPPVKLKVLDFCHKTLPDAPILPSMSLWRFEGKAPEIIHMFKYQSYTKLARMIGEKMAQAILEEESFNKADILIPVPLHKTRERERTYNQSRLLCEAISKKTGQPVVNDMLYRVKYTKTQTKLSAAARLSNVKHAFQVKSNTRITGKSIILVDDVLTTGATLTICAIRLQQAGAKDVRILTAVRA